MTAEITGKFDVALPPLRTWLADDLVARTVRVARIAVGLLEDGMPDERFEFAFNWTLFWDACGADPEAMELQARREDLSSELHESSGKDVTSTRDLYEQTNKAYIARWHELQRAFRQPVEWHDIPRVGKRAEKLGSAKSLPSLLERYEQLDREVTSLENGVSGAISSWNSMVSDAEQESRERQ